MPTRWYHYVAYFWGGAFLANFVPHFVNGISGSPTFPGLAYPSASSYTSVAAGSYQTIFTLPGQTFAEFITSGQSFSAGQNRTIAIMDGQSGGFTSTVLADLN